MKGILIAVAVALLAGCGDTPTVQDVKAQSNPVRVVVDWGADGVVYVAKIDGCEYVIYRGYYKGGIIHKANCSNPEHRSVR